MTVFEKIKVSLEEAIAFERSKKGDNFDGQGAVVSEVHTFKRDRFLKRSAKDWAQCH